MKNTVLAALLLSAGFALGAAFVSGVADAAEKPMTRAEVEAVVRDYIAAHPEEILRSVQNWQDKSVRERQADAMERNKNDIYSDLATPVAGNPDGDVTVVEFFDYNCGYCKRAMPDVQKLIEEDKGVRVMFKEFPILGPSSESAAKWALAANMQDRYFEYHRALMENRKPITDDLLESIAKDVGLDIEKAKRDKEGTEVLMQIERNRGLASSMDIRGTPAFIIGSGIAPGAIGLADMKKMVKAAREAAKE